MKIENEKIIELIRMQNEILLLALGKDTPWDPEIENIATVTMEMEDTPEVLEDREISVSKILEVFGYFISPRSTRVVNGDIDLFPGSNGHLVVRESQLAAHIGEEMPLDLSGKRFFAPRELCARWNRKKGSLTSRLRSIAERHPNALKKIRLGEKYRFELLDERGALEALNTMEQCTIDRAEKGA